MIALSLKALSLIQSCPNFVKIICESFLAKIRTKTKVIAEQRFLFSNHLLDNILIPLYGPEPKVPQAHKNTDTSFCPKR